MGAEDSVALGSRQPENAASTRAESGADARASAPERASERSHEPAHVPELDGVRGIAILLVLLFHSARHVFSVGWMGVDLFFVLSGFLISLGLQKTAGRPRYFRNFYTKRALRIWPIYYLLLACVFVLSPVVGWGEKPSASDWLPYTLYVQNLVHPLAAPVALGQMWSLAIEEQFYLVWPFVVLLVPRAALMKVALGTVAGSLAMRLAVAAAGAPSWTGYFATPCRVDALAFGAVLSILVLRGESGLAVIRKWAWPGAIAGTAGALPIAVALGSETISGAVSGNHDIARSLLFSFVALAGFGLVGLALGRVDARLSALLRAGWLRYLGKISYGLYIYHATVFQAVHLQVLAHATHPDAPATKLARSAIAMTLSVMLASVSWYVLERPILRLKATWAAEAPEPMSR